MHTSSRHRHPAPRRMFRMMAGMFENPKETWDKRLHEINKGRRVRSLWVLQRRQQVAEDQGRLWKVGEAPKRSGKKATS